MTMQQTSILSFIELNESGVLGARQQLVLDALRTLGTANNRELSEYLNLPINTITPRVNELRRKNLVEEDRKGTDAVTERLTLYWRVRK